jgi:hypothetical protein
MHEEEPMPATEHHPSLAAALPAQVSGVVSWTRDDDTHREVRELANQIARDHGVPLTLYALEAYTPLADPLPNATWSAEGAQTEFGDPLSVDDLERLGREQLAGQVLAASRSGVETGAWIPDKGGVEAMVAYALAHDANVVLLPSAIQEAGLLQRLGGVSLGAAAEADSETSVHMLLVAADGTVIRADQAGAEARS